MAHQSRELKLAYWPAVKDDRGAVCTIGDALRRAAAFHAERVALADGAADKDQRRWTYKELLEASEAVASRLLQRFQPGDRVAIWAPNRPEWVILEFGMALAGLTLVTVNPAYLDKEVEYVLGQSRVRGVIVEPEFRQRNLVEIAHTLQTKLPDLEFVLSILEVPIKGSVDHNQAVLPEVHPTDPAQIQYTSGTTGFPKGALQSHGGLTANGRLYAQAIGAMENDVWVNPMPLFHTAGCGLVTLGALQTGGTHVLFGGFEPSRMLQVIERERGTITLSVPTMLTRLLDHEDAKKRDLASWRLATLGGAPVAPELVKRAQRDFGVGVAIGFGQTEASPYITHTSPEDEDPEWTETVGRPLPGFDVKIVSPSDGHTLACGQIGEICARGPCIMLGYFENEDATAETVDTDRWLHTGDLGTMDESGRCRVVSRLKEMIIRGGENVYPREIEEVLIAHPAIAAAAVVGLPDPDLGESVAAAIQLHADTSMTKESLEAFCSDRLAFFKIPRFWKFYDEFPQTASGKVQKSALRENLMSSDSQGLVS